MSMSNDAKSSTKVVSQTLQTLDSKIWSPTGVPKNWVLMVKIVFGIVEDCSG